MRARGAGGGRGRGIHSQRRGEAEQPRGITPDQSVEVELAKKSLTLAAGALFVPMHQPAAALAAAALEPDSPGSFIGTGFIAVAAGTNEAPVYRTDVAATRSLRLMPLGQTPASACETL